MTFDKRPEVISQYIALDNPSRRNVWAQLQEELRAKRVLLDLYSEIDAYLASEDGDVEPELELEEPKRGPGRPRKAA